MGGSVVWKYFIKGDNNTEAQCTLCLKLIKTGGGTSNLRQHLKTKHPDLEKDETPRKLDFTEGEVADENATAVEPILTKRSRKKKRVSEDPLPRISAIRSNGIGADKFIKTKDQDEFDVFGQMVAAQIRKFSRRNQAVAKNTIQNFLFDMEMRELDETPAPVVETVLQSLDPSSPPQIAKHANTAEIDGVDQAL